MRTTSTFLALCALSSPLYALTIVSPFPGSTIDPTQPITIVWTSTSADPSTIDLKIDDANPNSLSTNQVLALGIKTSSDSFTIPANTIQNFGTGYQIQAVGSAGNLLSQAGGLSLGAGSGSVSTASNGQVSFVSTATASPEASGNVGTGGTTTAAAGTATKATSSFDTAAATAGTTILSGTVTAESTSPTSSSTKSSGFVTSSTAQTGTSTSEASAAATSAANTNTANSLGRMRSGGEVVMGAAGVLAGIVALIV